ncbi:MAG: hypothetical protein LQ352_004653 [Teloschistes flavicans]|nr:MAG: hypothetical protein LQ352_004653 [Teloschistes flavicans]
MVFRSILAVVTAGLAVSASAIPTSLNTRTAILPRAAEGEPFQCDDPSGAAAGKQALIGSGATSTDIAIAMLENGCAFHAAFPAGNNKADDSAELGVYRNNWYMLRTYCNRFQGASPGDWYNLGQQVQ